MNTRPPHKRTSGVVTRPQKVYDQPQNNGAHSTMQADLEPEGLEQCLSAL
jgi:hypothetical protein